MPNLLRTAAAALCVSLFTSAGAPAAELKVLAVGVFPDAFKELIPQFERTSGHKVTVQYAATPVLIKQIEAGEAFDVAITTAGPMNEAAKQGHFAAGFRPQVSSVGLGAAVRAGAPKPDIGTTEAFKRAMLNATSVGYTEGGGSGSYFVALLDKLGIADAMKPKLRPGTDTQAAVARGEVEMTVTGIVPILRSKGVVLAGPLPAELQSYSVFTAGISATTQVKDAAAALLQFLRTPEATAVFRRRGVEAMP